MSRIHDALKKAEMERAAVQSLEVSALTAPLSQKPRVEERHVNSGTAAEPRIQTQAPPASFRDDQFEIEEMLRRCAAPEWHPDPGPDVFGNPTSHPHGAEQFRTLRSRLYQLRGNRPLRTLLITSSIPAEGKTFVTGNLGQAIIRQADRRVLLIDADLRCSRLHRALGAPTTPGLSDYLRGTASEESVIQRGQPGNLWFIPGGVSVPNPSELLSNGRMKSLLERLAPVFDWVLIDSPPCLPVADASFLSGLCDGTLLVVKAGATPSALVQKAGHELQSGNVVGVVMNAVTYDSVGYNSYYTYGYGNNEQDVSK